MLPWIPAAPANDGCLTITPYGLCCKPSQPRDLWFYAIGDFRTVGPLFSPSGQVVEAPETNPVIDPELHYSLRRLVSNGSVYVMVTGPGGWRLSSEEELQVASD